MLTACVLATGVARAQAAREVRGTVARATGKGVRPLAGAWITLHRVGTDHAGPMDSVRSDGAGRYAFHYRATGDTAALYFVSIRFAGLAYFTAPLTGRVVTGADAGLVVYDTTSAPVPIRVRGRHVVVMAPDSGRTRRVVEAFELSNDSTVTRVSGARARPTFEALLPDGARATRAGEGDLPAEAVTFAEGRARVFAPLAPGVKRFSFVYRVKASAAPLLLPSLAGTSVLEVLVEDERGTATGGGLRETEPASLEGRRFRRFLAQDAPAAAVLSVTAPTLLTTSSLNFRIALIVVAVGAVLLLGLAAGLTRRGPARERAIRAQRDDPESLERELAALETAFAALDAPTPDEKADHYERRARLKARLTAALARREGLV